MSRLTDLIAQAKAKDQQLGVDLEREFKVLSSRLPYGLNFERHRPEAVELPDRPIRKGDKVRMLQERLRPIFVGNKVRIKQKEEADKEKKAKLWFVKRISKVGGEEIAELALALTDTNADSSKKVPVNELVKVVAKADRRLWQVKAIRRAGDVKVADLELSGEAKETQSVMLDDLAVVAEFRDTIYPGLISTGKVLRGGNKPFHTVINGENYHVLKALTYTHRGMVDVIYIDPPYNTGAKDWKYNNDYVEADDLYRHSQWLAMMERVLRIANELLNPSNSVLIVTIDEKEYLRLGLLLEEVFHDTTMQSMQMISTLINSKGTGRANEFRRVNEYIYFLWFGDAKLGRLSDSVSLAAQSSESFKEEESDEDEDLNESDGQDEDVTSEEAGFGLDWQTFRRRDLASRRGTKKGGPRQFYPIYVNVTSGHIEAVGDPLQHDVPRSSAPERKGCVAVFPIRKDGTEMNWAAIGPSFVERWKAGYARAGKATPDDPQEYIIQYLKAGSIRGIEEGRATITGRSPDGSVIAEYPEAQVKTPTTQWAFKSHNAEHYGTGVLTSLIPNRSFPFPKSLYAVEDSLRIFVADKPDAIVLDFFAGSGTTAHAVMRLNHQHGGRRQCISVTNNEVAADEQVALRKQGLRPGDPEWEQWGICDFINKPRVQAAITGRTPDGKPINEDYKFTDEFPMSQGFEENAEFFTLTYESPLSINHNVAFAHIAPLLWLRAGSRGDRIDKLPSEGWAVVDAYGLLVDLDAVTCFVKAVNKAKDLRVAYIVTDDDRRFQAIARRLPEDVEPVRLYESYLTNFRFANGE